MARLKKEQYDFNSSFKDDSGNSYSVDAARALKFWCRMESAAPVDLSPQGLSPIYVNSPTRTQSRIGQNFYPSFIGEDASNKSAEVVDSSGGLDFSTAPDGGPPAAGTNLPFSVSCWVNLPNISNQTLFSKECVSSGGIVTSFYVSIDGGRINALLSDSANGIEATWQSAFSIFSYDQWNHIVLTYNGEVSAGGDPTPGVNVYLNGVAQVNTYSTPITGYVGANPSYSNPFNMGDFRNGAFEIDGNMAELGAWQKELTYEEVLTIYNVTKDSRYLSGIDTNPARILLQERDSATGSYPTIARTGDPDFMGQYTSTFDDTNTIIFSGGNLVYPTNLPASS